MLWHVQVRVVLLCPVTPTPPSLTLCATPTAPVWLPAQVHVLNGEKYREVCPENTLLNSMQLRGCIISPHHKKPLLKRESALGVSEDTRIFLEVEVRGAHTR